jgi:hypothetical protein
VPTVLFILFESFKVSRDPAKPLKFITCALRERRQRRKVSG